MPPTLRDIAGHPLGSPARVVPIRTKDDLLRALQDAAAEHLPVTAMGLRSSYWHGLNLEGAVALDLTGYDRVLSIDEEAGVARVQAGIPLRALDGQLRARGYQLAMHPDSFGDSPVGSAIAAGCTAGMGMMRRSFLDQIVGFEAVLADGRLLQVGSSRALGRPEDGVALGLPDLRSLFFGSEGALGVLSEIDVALLPAAWEAQLEWSVGTDRVDDVLALARRWRRRDLLDTIRWEWTGSGTLGLFVSSQLDAADLERRIALLLAELPGWPAPRIHRRGEAWRRGDERAADEKWRGAPGETWRRDQKAPFFGIDAMLSYAEGARAYAWARSLVVPGAQFTRIALYCGADGVNLGIHCVSSHEARDGARAALEAKLPELSAFGAVPYRTGVAWRPLVLGRLDPTTRAVLAAVGRVLDPDGRLDRGVGVFGS